MYRVAVCDDEADFARDFAAQVGEVLGEAQIPYELDIYGSCDALFHAVSDGTGYHMLLVDILMEGMSGMDFARRLREQDEETALVFITCTDRYLGQGYDVQAAHYLQKPVLRKDLRRVLLRDYTARFQREYLSIQQGDRLRAVPVGDLMYIEAAGRMWLYHLRGERVEVSTRERFDMLGERLPSCVVRCHRGYYLNIRAVRELTKTRAFTEDGSTVPVSRAYYREIHRAMTRELLFREDKQKNGEA